MQVFNWAEGDPVLRKILLAKRGVRIVSAVRQLYISGHFIISLYLANQNLSRLLS